MARVAIAGATGLVGTALTAELKANGHEVLAISRRPGPGRIPWDVAAGRLDPAALEGCDAVVNLAGESIASGLWTDARLAAIRDSRVRGTELLASTIAKLDRKPAVLVQASAVGHYGHRGDEELDESAPAGGGVLAGICTQWEAAALPAAEAGIRLAWMRLGIVLSRKGGALAAMLWPFRFGVGGRLGPGTQWFPWVHLDDVAGAFAFVLGRDDLAGAFNLTAPEPATNREYTAALGRALGRPTWFPVPSWLLRLAPNGQGERVFLDSTKAVPRRLREAGYVFRHPSLAGALAAEFPRSAGR